MHQRRRLARGGFSRDGRWQIVWGHVHQAQGARHDLAEYRRGDEAAKVLTEIKRKGMTVFELPPEEIAKLRERSKPVIEKYTTELGPIVGDMYAAVDKARKTK